MRSTPAPTKRDEPSIKKIKDVEFLNVQPLETATPHDYLSLKCDCFNDTITLHLENKPLSNQHRVTAEKSPSY